MSNCDQNSNCYYGSSRSYNVPNNVASPASQPNIIDAGDSNSQIMVPILTNVIQNCAQLKKYEAGFVDNLVFTTNFTKANAPTGNVVITKINFSYDALGIPENTIDGYVNNQDLSLQADTPAAVCTIAPAPTDANAAKTQNLYTSFSAAIKTETVCCDGQEQPYSLCRIVNRAIPFSICNLSINIEGCIGGTPFTASLAGTTATTTTATTTTTTITALTNPMPLSDLGFASQGISFAGRMSLPAGREMTLTDDFSCCLIIDSLRPVSETFTPLTATGTTPADTDPVQFAVSADLSVVAKDQVYALTSEKLAVLSNAGSKVVCQDGSNVPTCPEACSCQKPPCQQTPDTDNNTTPTTPGTEVTPEPPTTEQP